MKRQGRAEVLLSNENEGLVGCFSLEMNPRELRQALREITELPPDVIPNHPDLVAALRKAYPHSIVNVTDLEVVHLPLQKFTCFMHAFRLVNASTATYLMDALQTQPRSDFVAHVAARHLSEISPEDAADGDLILYFDNQNITHAGKVRAARVVSKWGIGWVWEHEVFEVPMQYGDKVRFYSRVEQQEVEQLFVSYVRSQEGVELVDELLARLR